MSDKPESPKESIGKQLKDARIGAGKSYKDIPMNYRTIKNMEEGNKSYEIDNLLEYMGELQLFNLTINIRKHGND